MGIQKVLHYVCQSCGKGAAIDGWNQANIPRCPLCSIRVCGKCGVGKFCKKCATFLENDERDNLTSLEQLAGAHPLKILLFCLVTPVFSLISINGFIHRQSEGPALATVTVFVVIGLCAWQVMASIKLDRAYKIIIPAAKRRRKEMMKGNKDEGHSPVSIKEGISTGQDLDGQPSSFTDHVKNDAFSCPRCGCATIAVPDPGSAKILRYCTRCGIV